MMIQFREINIYFTSTPWDDTLQRWQALGSAILSMVYNSEKVQEGLCCISNIQAYQCELE